MDPYETAVMERIRELLKYRRWFDEYHWLKPYLWPAFRSELLVLLRLARKVRKAQRVDDRGNHYRFAVVPGPDNREYLDDVRNDRELMRDEMHGRDIDGSLRW